MPTPAGRCRRPCRRAGDAVHDLRRGAAARRRVLGLAANTAIAEATSIYLRYEGNISGQDSAHAITAGVRMTW